jgi:hypothetical protein
VIVHGRRPLLATTMNNHARTATAQFERDGPADTAGRTRDDGHFSHQSVNLGF